MYSTHMGGRIFERGTSLWSYAGLSTVCLCVCVSLRLYLCEGKPLQSTYMRIEAVGRFQVRGRQACSLCRSEHCLPSPSSVSGGARLLYATSALPACLCAPICLSLHTCIHSSCLSVHRGKPLCMHAAHSERERGGGGAGGRDVDRH